MNKHNLFVFGNDSIRDALSLYFKNHPTISIVTVNDAEKDKNIYNSSNVLLLYSKSNPEDFFQAIAQTQKIVVSRPFLSFCYDENKSEFPVTGTVRRNNGTEIPFEMSSAIKNSYQTLIPSRIVYSSALKSDIESFFNTPFSEEDIVSLRMAHFACLLSAWAFNMYVSVFKEVAHGDAMDFSNSFLAPIAAGYQLPKERKDAYFKSLLPLLHNSATIKKISEFFPNNDLRNSAGALYAGMLKNIDLIKSAFAKNGKLKKTIYQDPNIREAVSQILSTTGQIREWAGFGEYSKVGDDRSLSLPTGSYKILVVDDHSDFWIPYFVEIKKFLIENKHLDTKSTVEFYFSKTGEELLKLSDLGELSSTDKAVAPFLPDFDLVFLDIVLGKEGSGIVILDDIRKSLPTLPVIIASTKHDPNLVDQLQRANAFVYKKNLHLDQLAELVSRLLLEGHGRKKQSLPNPFFNDNIINKREEVTNFTNWAIKHLDGFHGVDNDFFRYFNDHGGRHMTSLMSILERLIRPFLLLKEKKDQEDLLGMSNDECRKENILCLYLAVLTHEFGMFPLRTIDHRKSIPVGREERVVTAGKEKDEILIEDYSSSAFQTPRVFETIKDKYPNSSFTFVPMVIRKFHGARSMFMILDKQLEDSSNPLLQYPEFRSAFDEICPVTSNNSDLSVLRAKIAAMTGYHNRFMSLDNNDFLKAIGKKEFLLDEIANTSIASLIKKANFEKALNKINAVVPENEKEQLRRLCAIFRFADALDIDYSRAIPCYLGYNDEGKMPWQEKGYIEDLKRYIVKRVDIDCGKITIVFNMYAPGTGNNKNTTNEVFSPEIGELKDSILEEIIKDNEEKIRSEISANQKIFSVPSNVKIDIIETRDSTEHQVVEKENYIGKYRLDENKNAQWELTAVTYSGQVEVATKKIGTFLDMIRHAKELLTKNKNILMLSDDKFSEMSDYEKVKEWRDVYEEALNAIFKHKLKEYCITPEHLIDNTALLDKLKQKICSLLCGMVMLELYDEYHSIAEVNLTDMIHFGTIAFEKPVVDFNLLERMRDRYRS